jgi:IclR family transcriptional regulator, KDG regulon repressor
MTTTSPLTPASLRTTSRIGGQKSQLLPPRAQRAAPLQVTSSQRLKHSQASKSSKAVPVLSPTNSLPATDVTDAAIQAIALGGDNAVSMISRAFSILAAFRNEPVLGVSALSRRTGIPRTSVHRIASQLLEEGALSRVGTKFRIGATLFELGNLHFPERLRDILQPLLDDLQRATGCNVSLLELVGDDAIVIAAARDRRTRTKIGHLGQRIPASACAGGQVLLAQEKVRPPTMLRKLTNATIVDPKTLQRRLADIRTSGFAIDHGEAETACSGIAVPVVNRHGRVLGALMLTASTVGFEVETNVNTAQAFGKALTAAGQHAAIGFFASARPRLEDETN